MSENPKIFRLARHVVSVLVALLFALAAAMKWFELPIQVQRFEVWGYPEWFMHFVGALEYFTADLLVLFRTRLWGAALGLSVIIGASCTHLLHGQWVDVLGSAVTATLLFGIIWLHWHLLR